MKTDFFFILPTSFYGENLTPGHKLAIFKLAEKLRIKNKSVEIIYSDKKYIYDSALEKTTIKLKDIFENKIYQDSVIVIGPTHSFRSTLFMRKKRIIYHYVFDSILKTSLYAFLNDFRLIHRVIYAYLVELILRKQRIIVSSLEEYTWFSSSGHKNENIYLMTGPPDITLSSEICLNKDGKKKVIIYNPTGGGLLIAKSLIQELIYNKIDIEIIVTGVEASTIKNDLPLHTDLYFRPYVENISNLISTCTIAVLTDVFGSGFCNRASQIRSLGVPLLCTLPSLRGTGLIFDPSVQVLYSPHQGAKFIKENLGTIKPSECDIVKSIIFCANRDANYFEESCVEIR